MIVSVHEYELADTATEADFREAVEEALERRLFDALPGLVEYRFCRGVRGERDGKFTALWTYESQDAWAALWGPVGEPVEKAEYPEEWRIWEDELLEPVLSDDPDDIAFTSYEVWEP